MVFYGKQLEQWSAHSRYSNVSCYGDDDEEEEDEEVKKEKEREKRKRK